MFALISKFRISQNIFNLVDLIEMYSLYYEPIHCIVSHFRKEVDNFLFEFNVNSGFFKQCERKLNSIGKF
jgi:hypothetical protein